MSEITGLLLAAGSSSRFGGHKLLQVIRGKPLVLHSAASLQPCDRVIVVVRQNDHPLQDLLQSAGIETIINHEAEQGMGRSIACGVKASEGSDGWCVLPGDMPFVDTNTTMRIAEQMRNGAELVAPFYHGQRGHPVCFSRRYREQLMALQGDTGARDIVRVEHEVLTKVIASDPWILVDIDMPEDLVGLDMQPLKD